MPGAETSERIHRHQAASRHYYVETALVLAGGPDMAAIGTEFVLGRLRDLVFEQASDQQLLEQYLSCRNQGAFAALVRRYGGLVLGVCRGVLSNRQDAQDAFQATFVVLGARRRPSAGANRSVAGSTALPIASRSNARSQSVRQREIPECAPAGRRRPSRRGRLARTDRDFARRVWFACPTSTALLWCSVASREPAAMRRRNGLAGLCPR